MMILKKRVSITNIIKTSISSALVLIIVFAATPVHAAPKAFCVIEVSSGRVLKSESANEVLPIASLTKVLTCIIAIENCHGDEIVKVSDNAAYTEGSSMHLRSGEEIKLGDVLYGLMLCSGNDAAVALAEHLSGSVENFALLMNEKSKQIGAISSNFVTPHGLPNKDHYSTAADFAKICVYAMLNERFAKIVSTQQYKTGATNKRSGRVLKNTNKLLYSYGLAAGIKTGYTDAAGRCLAAAADNGEMMLVGVLLNDKGRYEDSISLFNEIFSEYKMTEIQLAGKQFGTIEVIGGILPDVKVQVLSDKLLPLSENEVRMVQERVNIASCVIAPVANNRRVGTVDYVIDGEVIASSGIYTIESVRSLNFLENLGVVLGRWIGADSQIFSRGGSSFQTAE